MSSWIRLTNADAVRAMTDKEWPDWLKQEVEE